MTEQTRRVDWFQTISTLAILVGVFLVAYELRQNRALDLGQMDSEGYARVAELYLTLQGDEPIVALMKDCFNEPLSREEAGIVHFYFQDWYNAASRLRWVGDAHPEIDWVDGARSNLRQIFITERGRQWWSLGRSTLNAEIVTIGDEVLKNLPAISCQEYFEALAAPING